MTGNFMHRVRRAALTFAAVVALPLAGCDTDALLRVDDPDILDPSKLQSAQGAAVLRAGAIGDFAFAHDGNGGGTEGMTTVTGTVADEYSHSGTFSTRQEYDQRAVELANVTLTGIFRSIQRARNSAERALTTIAAYASDSTHWIAEMNNVSAFSYVVIGEAYCSGVPFSNSETGDYGPPLTTAEIFQEAITRFDVAIAAGSSDPVHTNAARVGKGRALLNLGQFAAAAAAVATVPDGFAYQIQHGTTSGRQENGVYVFNVLSERFSMADLEGGNGLDFRTAGDPRTPWGQNPVGDLGFDGDDPQYDALKYTSREDPTNLADGTEARLIEAEALLQAGDFPGWLGKLNGLRSGAGMTALADPGTAAGREDLMFRERAFWLFATGHRLGDLRRLIRQYGRTEDQVFPTGAYHEGGVYGDDVNLPVPLDEANNPSFTGCLNRDA